METAGIEIPATRSGIDRRIVAAAIAATALAGLAGGYAFGTASDAAPAGVTIVGHAAPATWDDAFRESAVVKQHAREAARAAALAAQLDIRMARVEK
jgi:hypothetical protein